jgi:anaerobic selenocysteine-containing dehydrogenase
VLFVHQQTAAKLELADDDWVWIESVNGRVKGQIKLIDGVNPDTVWTWNAIGKRRGAWALKADAPESNRGFLLNHAIGDQLPLTGNGRRYSNSDPVTGQAAWFDLRVRLSKAAAAFTEPRFAPLPLPPGLHPPPNKLAFGAEFKKKVKVG